MRLTISEWLWLILAGLLFLYVADAHALQLSAQGCMFYAEDSRQIAVMRDAGIAEDAAQKLYSEKSYHPDVRPHLIDLIHFVYTSPLTPVELRDSLYTECIRNEGAIGGKL